MRNKKKLIENISFEIMQENKNKIFSFDWYTKNKEIENDHKAERKADGTDVDFWIMKEHLHIF